MSLYADFMAAVDQAIAEMERPRPCARPINHAAHLTVDGQCPGRHVPPALSRDQVRTLADNARQEIHR